MKVAGARFMEAIIMILVAAGIFNTLFVSVMERVREFGIMMAIGFSPARLFGLVMCESLWLGLVGLVLAAVVTAGPYYYMATAGIDLTAQMGGAGSEVAGVAVSTRHVRGHLPREPGDDCQRRSSGHTALGTLPGLEGGTRRAGRIDQAGVR